eukprot:TRINITY_DN23846_c0_g1_i1.p1 TRINITY_DN23846_c0_g1~~TRINITY_DN23846_c0_g1_i1.p1  ORF type:complete len:581 (-),score=115.41 TRINITY_DN23846_c0_g1_i1:323-1924(-)
MPALKNIGIAPPAPGLILMDAGSSGTKIASYRLEGKEITALKMKVLTSCSAAGSFPSQGLAALEYGFHKCQPELSCDPEAAAPHRCHMHCGCARHDDERCKAECEAYAGEMWEAARPAKERKYNSGYQRLHFTQQLLKIAAKLHDVFAKTTAINSKKIPILATAGMRLLTKEANDQIWGKICGQHMQSGSYGFAPREVDGNIKCGTIPGVDEAYYEFISNVVNKAEGTPMEGTFTLGGASGQISIPLGTDDEVAAFQNLMKQAQDIFGDCSTITLRDGKSPIPFFNAQGECYKDFIDFRDAAWLEEKLGGKFKELFADGNFKGVGLISFLGLTAVKDGRAGLAGGVNLIEEWAETPGLGCSSKIAAAEFKGFFYCREKLLEALQSDKFFMAVVHYFRASKLEVTHFAYNTFAATPSMQFSWEDIQKMAQLTSSQLPDAAWDRIMNMQDRGDPKVATLLEWLVKTQCESANKNHPFGFKGSNSCMKALFVAEYIAMFFSNSHTLAQMELSETVHTRRLSRGTILAAYASCRDSF